MQVAARARRRVLLLPCRPCRRRTPQEEFGGWLDVGEGAGGGGWPALPLYATGRHCYRCGRSDLGGLARGRWKVLSWEPLREERGAAVR